MWNKLIDALLFILAWGAILITFWLFLGLDLRMADM